LLSINQMHAIHQEIINYGIKVMRSRKLIKLKKDGARSTFFAWHQFQKMTVNYVSFSFVNYCIFGSEIHFIFNIGLEATAVLRCQPTIL
jgi:hypothetical protein